MNNSINRLFIDDGIFFKDKGDNLLNDFRIIVGDIFNNYVYRNYIINIYNQYSQVGTSWSNIINEINVKSLETLPYSIKRDLMNTCRKIRTHIYLVTLLTEISQEASKIFCKGNICFNNNVSKTSKNTIIAPNFRESSRFGTSREDVPINIYNFAESFGNKDVAFPCTSIEFINLKARRYSKEFTKTYIHKLNPSTKSIYSDSILPSEDFMKYCSTHILNEESDEESDILNSSSSSYNLDEETKLKLSRDFTKRRSIHMESERLKEKDYDSDYDSDSDSDSDSDYDSETESVIRYMDDEQDVSDFDENYTTESIYSNQVETVDVEKLSSDDEDDQLMEQFKIRNQYLKESPFEESSSEESSSEEESS